MRALVPLKLMEGGLGRMEARGAARWARLRSPAAESSASRGSGTAGGSRGEAAGGPSALPTRYSISACTT